MPTRPCGGSDPTMRVLRPELAPTTPTQEPGARVEPGAGAERPLPPWGRSPQQRKRRLEKLRPTPRPQPPRAPIDLHGTKGGMIGSGVDGTPIYIQDTRIPANGSGTAQPHPPQPPPSMVRRKSCCHPLSKDGTYWRMPAWTPMSATW